MFAQKMISAEGVGRAGEGKYTSFQLYQSFCSELCVWI